MIIISAMAENNRAIGSGEGMPWSVPEEYQNYIGLVSGHVVIMGRKSYEIFGEDLAETDTRIVVVTRQDMELANAIVCHDIDSAVEAAKGTGRKVFCAGGARIYAQCIPLADDMFLSTIKGEFEGDAFFPDFDEDDWKVVDSEDHERFTFRHYQRVH